MDNPHENNNDGQEDIPNGPFLNDSGQAPQNPNPQQPQDPYGSPQPPQNPYNPGPPQGPGPGMPPPGMGPGMPPPPPGMGYPAPPPAPYGQHPQAPGPGMPPPPMGQYNPGYGTPDHPQAMMILILGILGIVCCGPAGIVAIIMGQNARKDIAQGLYPASASVTAGWILGIVAVSLWALYILIYLLSSLVTFT